MPSSASEASCQGGQRAPNSSHCRDAGTALPWPPGAAVQSGLRLRSLIPPWSAPGFVFGVIFNEGSEVWRILSPLSAWIYTESQGKGMLINLG